ncbi:hypothetical protein HpVa122_08080 [Helicobacter pylori]|nr:hypothetical protein VN1175_01670 [Helicobacter pylori]
MFKSRLNSWILLGIFGILVVVFLGCYKIQNRRFETCSLSITSERKGRIL